MTHKLKQSHYYSRAATVVHTVYSLYLLYIYNKCTNYTTKPRMLCLIRTGCSQKDIIMTLVLE